MLSRQYLQVSLNQIKDQQAALARKGQPVSDRLQWAVENGARVAEQVETAKQIIRSHEFYNEQASLDAFLALTQGLEIASLPFAPTSFELTTFQTPIQVDNSQQLLNAIRNPRINPFYDIFSRGIIKIYNEKSRISWGYLFRPWKKCWQR